MLKNNHELREFAIKIYEELKLSNENKLSNELNSWSENTYTSSSEFLGDLMLILKKVLQISIGLKTRSEIEDCIFVIEKLLK